MRELTFTVYDKAEDRVSKPLSLTWEGWIERFSVHAVRGAPADTASKEALDRAKNGPAVLLGEIHAGLPRRKSNVVAAHALSLDVENCTDEQISAALEQLSPFEYFVWTTHKHGSEVVSSARLRVVLPLDVPLSPSQYAGAWAGLQELVGGINDPATKDIARLNYLPSTFDASKAWVLRHPGRWLSLADLPVKEEVVVDQLRQQKVTSGLRECFSGVPRDEPVLREQVRGLLRGEAFAQPGGRHEAVLALTLFLAKRETRATDEALESLFRDSLAAMSREASGTPTVDEVITAYRGAVLYLQRTTQEKQQEAQLDAVREGAGPYTDEDLERIASVNGWSVDDLPNKWIVQRDGAGWFLSSTGAYWGPYLREDLPIAASQFLARAPVRLVELTKNGMRYRPLTEVARERGSLAEKVVADLTAQRTWFETKSHIMHEAVCPLRTDLTPEFSPQIDGWLKVLAGPHYGKLVDWMSCCGDLTKLLCAVYFDGPPSCGKTLFAVGMARLWTDGPPADIESVLADFNDDLVRCPLALADEEIPKRYGRATVTAVLRSALSTTSRPLKRKFRATAELRGAIRIVLAANNEFLLDSKDVSTQDDLAAIGARFLYISVPDGVSDLLNDYPKSVRESWAQRGIAQHALWLMQNHVVKEPGRRFWVEGDISRMHRNLMVGTKWNSMVCEWIVRYLMNPKPFDTTATGLIRRGGGKLLVNVQGIIDGWTLYLQTKQEAETAKIGSALKAISRSKKPTQLRANGKQVWFRDIDLEQLCSWSDSQSIGDRETMKAAVQ